MSTNPLPLTSIECSDLINWIAFNKYGIALNKTQMQKLLYLSYGIYLSTTNSKLFLDDTPKAWPFGPVFPRVNKYFSPGSIPSIPDLPVKKVEADRTAFSIINDVVKRYHNKSATKLSEWSHEENGPWYKTVYGEGEAKWNKEISDDLIKIYFPKYEQQP